MESKKKLKTDRTPLGFFGKHILRLKETGSVMPETLKKFRAGRLKKVLEDKPDPVPEDKSDPEDTQLQEDDQSDTADKIKPSEQDEKIDATKGFGYFKKKIEKIMGLDIYINGLILGIDFLFHFPAEKDGENPIPLTVMGIERKQILEILKTILGEFSIRFKRDRIVESIGDRDVGSKKEPKEMLKVLFDHVFEFDEETGTKEIDDALEKLDTLASEFDGAKDQFFGLPLEYSKIVNKLNEEKTDGDQKVTTQYSFIRRMLNLGLNENIHMMDFLDRPDETIPYNIDFLIEGVGMTSKISELIELAETINKLEEDNPMRQKYTKLNHDFFTYFLSFKKEIPLEELKTHIVKILRMSKSTTTHETISEDLEDLYDEISALVPDSGK